MGKTGAVTDERIDGVLAGLAIATPDGWRAAGQVQAGDLVWCMDDAPQPVLAVRRHLLRHPRAVLVPARALGNPAPVILLPDQPVALELDQAALIYGDPVALIPARALVGWRGITACRAPAGMVVRLVFVRRQVIYAGPGLLLGCAGIPPRGLRPEGPPAPPLTAGQARHLMTCVMAEEVGAGLRPNLLRL